MLEPWLVFFVLFGPFWWGLIVLSSIAIICSLENDSGPWATTFLIATLLALTFFGQPTLPALILQNPFMVVGGFIFAYLVGGSIYGVVKWYLFCHKTLEEYEKVKLAWLRSNGVTSREVPDGLKFRFKQHIVDNYSKWTTNVYEDVVKEDGRTSRERVYKVEIRPRPWDHASQILLWMVYWPWSLIWSLFDDIVRGIFIRIRRGLVDMMDWISQIVFKNVDQDFTTKPTVPPVDAKNQ